MTPRPPPAILTAATLVGLVLGLFALVVMKLASHFPLATELGYSRALYPWISACLSGLSRLVPFSVGEWVLLGLVIYFLGKPYFAWRAARAADRSWTIALWAVLVRTASAAGLVYALFVLLWGLNYSRLAPERLFDLQSPKPSMETENLVAAIGARLDQLRSTVDEDDAGVVVIRRSLDDVDQELERLQREVLGEHQLPTRATGRAKRFLSSPLLSRWGVSGVYSPFTGEPQLVVPTAPGMLPFVLAHERAHLNGLAWEEAASFVGLLTVWRSDDPAVQYSGWLELWIALGRSQVGRAAGVQRDLAAIDRFLRERRGRESAAIWQIYSSYLKSQGVIGGVKSYRRVAGLALGHLLKKGLPP